MVRQCESCLQAFTDLNLDRSISKRTSRNTPVCKECASHKTSKFWTLLTPPGLRKQKHAYVSFHRSTPIAKRKNDDYVPTFRNNTIVDVNRDTVTARRLNDIYCKWTDMNDMTDMTDMEEVNEDLDQSASLFKPDQKNDKSEKTSMSPSSWILQCSFGLSRESSDVSSSSSNSSSNSSSSSSAGRSVHWADDTGHDLETIHHSPSRFRFLLNFKACLRSNTDP